MFQLEVVIDFKGKEIQEEGVEYEVKKCDLKWLEKDWRVRNFLSMSLVDIVLRKVIKEFIVYDMWVVLENIY